MSCFICRMTFPNKQLLSEHLQRSLICKRSAKVPDMNVEKLQSKNNFNYKNTLSNIKEQQIVKLSTQLSLQNFPNTSAVWNHQAGQENLTSFFNCERCYRSFDTSRGLVNHYCSQVRNRLRFFLRVGHETT